MKTFYRDCKIVVFIHNNACTITITRNDDEYIANLEIGDYKAAIDWAKQRIDNGVMEHV